MRVLLLLALVVHLGAVETTLTLRDGRVLHGSYDERTGDMTIVVGDTGHAACHVEPGDIVTRKDVVVPEEAVETPIELARHLQEAEDAAASERQRIANERRLYDAEVQRKKDESEARARQRVFDRAAYWHAQGMTFPMVGLSIEEMDTKAAAYKKAAFWKARGQSFNPESVTEEEMDRTGREVETQAAILKQRQDEEAEAERVRQVQILADQVAEKKEQGELAAQRKQQDEDERQANIQRRQQVEADREDELNMDAKDDFIQYEVESVAAVVLLGAIALWIAPAYIAKKRRHRNFLAITILCLLLPFFGCVALLIHEEIPVAAAIQRAIIGSIELVAWAIALIWSLYRSQKDSADSQMVSGELLIPRKKRRAAMSKVARGLEPLEIADAGKSLWQKEIEAPKTVKSMRPPVEPAKSVETATLPESVKPVDPDCQAQEEIEKNQLLSYRNRIHNRSSKDNSIFIHTNQKCKRPIGKSIIIATSVVIFISVISVLFIGSAHQMTSTEAGNSTNVHLSEAKNQVKIVAEYTNGKEIEQQAGIQSISINISAAKNNYGELDKESVYAFIIFIFKVKSSTPLPDTGANVFIDSPGLIKRDHPDNLCSWEKAYYNRDGNCVASFMCSEHFDSNMAIWSLMNNGGTFTIISQNLKIQVELPKYLSSAIYEKMANEIRSNSNRNFHELLFSTSKNNTQPSSMY